jgi:putative FmdB family regulatory protein
LPLYEYACEKCKNHFEKIEHVGAPETRKCPKCGAKAMRVLSAPAIQFKGTGWYVTDYAGKSGGGDKPGSDGAGESKASGDGKGSGEKAETKKTESTKESAGKSKGKKKE